MKKSYDVFEEPDELGGVNKKSGDAFDMGLEIKKKDAFEDEF